MMAPRFAASQCLRGVSLAASIFFLANDVTAAAPTFGPTGPPLSYPLEQVGLSMTRRPGNASLPVEKIELKGSGTGTIALGTSMRKFAFQSRELLPLLNALYGIRFFDLPSDATTRYSVFIKADGSLGTSFVRMFDASSTELCFSLSAPAAPYLKCVAFSDDGLVELRKVGSDVSAFAKRVAN
jgi:hypothetical protein